VGIAAYPRALGGARSQPERGVLLVGQPVHRGRVKNMTVSLVEDIPTAAERWNGHTWAAQPTRSP
jgi:hypothetical protein